MSLISSRSLDCRQTSTMCAPLRICQRAISLASSHFSCAIRFLNSREPMTLVRSPTMSGRLLSYHAAVSFDGHGRHYRSWKAQFALEPRDRNQASLQTAGVERCFKQQNVHAAFDQRFGLFIVVVAQLLESNS